MTFSEKLKDLRTKRGITQTQLADDIHISRSAIAKWENGLGLPNDESINLLAEYFNVPTEDFLSVTNEISPVDRNTDNGKEEPMDEKLTAIGCSVIVGIVLFVLGFIFIPPLRGSMLGLALAACFSLIGVFGRFGGSYFLELFSAKNVSEENEKAFCKVMSNGFLCFGISILLTELIELIADVNLWFFWVAGGIVGLGMIFYAHGIYNNKK